MEDIKHRVVNGKLNHPGSSIPNRCRACVRQIADNSETPRRPRAPYSFLCSVTGAYLQGLDDASGRARIGGD